MLERKYCERYLSAQPKDIGAGESGRRRRNRYAPLFSAPHSSFDPASAQGLDGFLYEPFYQIMRQRLLADRMVHERELDVDEAKVVVVVPEDNWPYRTVADGSTTTSPLLAQRFPDLGKVGEVMRACLKYPVAQRRQDCPIHGIKPRGRQDNLHFQGGGRDQDHSIY